MSNPQNVGLFVPTTNVWDVNEIYSTDVTSEAFKELLVRLYQNLSNISVATNAKDSAIYNTSEFVTGGQFFANKALSSGTAQTPTLRPVFRKVIDFGALPNAGVKTVAHGINPTPSFTFTRIYGAATQPNTSFIPLPYVSLVLANMIELSVDITNVMISTAINYSAYTKTYIILEYIKT